MFYTRKRFFLKVRDFWFCSERKMENEDGADFVQYHDVNWNIHDTSSLVSSTNSQTLINDLLEDMDSIQKKIKKNGRYEIRRAKREGFNVVVIPSQIVLEQKNILKRIANRHSHMFAQKGLKRKDEYPIMYAAAEANMLTVSVCTTKTGKECVYHVYITGTGRARLLHSISVYRDANNAEERNAIGRANRLSHFEDMIWFKEHGFSVYDWGGYSNGRLAGIDDFKASFGGRIENRYSFILSRSLLGHLLGFVLKRRTR